MDGKENEEGGELLKKSFIGWFMVLLLKLSYGPYAEVNPFLVNVVRKLQ